MGAESDSGDFRSTLDHLGVTIREGVKGLQGHQGFRDGMSPATVGDDGASLAADAGALRHRLARFAQFRQFTPAADPEEATQDAGAVSTSHAMRDFYAIAKAIQDNQDAQARQLERICEAIDGAVHLLTQANRPDYFQSISLKASQPVILDRMGYKACYLLLTQATSVTVDIPGLGSFTRAMTADTNMIAYPTSTRLTIATDTNPATNGLLWFTDTIINAGV